jgi:hypothetical protein
MQDEALYQRCNKLQSTILAIMLGQHDPPRMPFSEIVDSIKIRQVTHILMQDVAENLKTARNQFMDKRCTAAWFDAYLAEIEKDMVF